MPVPTHFRFVIRGDFAGSPEQWSFGFHMSRDNPAGQDAGLGDIDEAAVTTAFTSYLSNARTHLQVVATDWRAYIIGTDGKMEGNGPLLHTFPPNTVKGTGDTSKHPPQVSLALTTVALGRGPARFGRFYHPGPNAAVDSTWRLSASDAGQYAAAASQLLKDVSNAIDLELTQSAQGLNVSPGPAGSAEGTRQTIDHVECGRAFDTLRNRRKSLVEDRVVDAHIDW